MLRRHRAAILLALAALLGIVEAPASAESNTELPRIADDDEPSIVLPPMSIVPTMPRPVARPTDPSLADDWSQRIAARLAAVANPLADGGSTRDEGTPEAEPDPRSDRPAPSSALQRALAAIAARPPRSSTIGIAVRRLEEETPVFEWRGDQALNPASNQKILTATAALELLGPDYRFETRVMQSDDTLVLVGEGDPSLQVEDLESMADLVAERIDLSTIRRLIIDDSAFSRRRFGPGYDPQGPGVSYMAPSGALSLQWNTVEISVRGAARGKPVHIELSPPSDHVVIHNAATGGRGRVSVQTRADGTQTVVDVDGRLRAGAWVRQRRRITDPGHFTGSAFAALLHTRGAPESLSAQRAPKPPSAHVVLTHHSAPLPELLHTMLSYSNNFASEQILRTLGWRMSGEAGDWTNGRLALRRYWDAAGLPLEDLVFENASGLSSSGRVTARSLADLLAFATRDGADPDALSDVLPLAGHDGTLRRRLRRAQGRVRAKTGTMRGVSTLSGIVQTQGGEHLSFAILVEGARSAQQSRRIQDRIVMTLVNHDQSG